MLWTLATIVFLLLIALWTMVHEKRHTKVSFTAEADEAVRTVRRVARKRAHAASIPMPMEFEFTPVHGVPTVTPPVDTPPNGTGSRNGFPRAASQPYSQHNRQGRKDVKIIKR